MAIGINILEILKKQPQFLGVELDGRLGAALDVVVTEVVFEDFG